MLSVTIEHVNLKTGINLHAVHANILNILNIRVLWEYTLQRNNFAYFLFLE